MTKGNGWTEERRRKQSEAIKRWKPWEKSTGPRTEKGKAVSSMNAFQSGRYSVAGYKLLEVLSHNAAFVRCLHEYYAACNAIAARAGIEIDLENELMEGSCDSEP